MPIEGLTWWLTWWVGCEGEDQVDFSCFRILPVEEHSPVAHSWELVYTKSTAIAQIELPGA